MREPNLQKNKPPPTEEELAEQERKFLESREEEYAAIRAENARKREEDLILKAQVSERDYLRTVTTRLQFYSIYHTDTYL